MTDYIASPTNPRIKKIVRLRNRRDRDESGVFTVEGYRELRRGVDCGLMLEELFVCPPLYLGANEPGLAEEIAAAGTVITDVSEEAFRKASYRERPEGLLGIARQFSVTLDDLSMGADPLLLVVEAIEKPGNLGTMLRTADAAGLTGVIVADQTTDVFNPNVVRASLGTLFSVPVAVTTTAAAIQWLQSHDVRIVATTPDASLAHTAADLTGAVAIAVGSEQYGLSEAWLGGEEIVIPMPGSVDSINAAMAAGVVVFEALRQRG